MSGANWYKKPSLLVSIAGVLISLGALGFSYYSFSWTYEIDEKQTELSQKQTAISKKQLQLEKKLSRSKVIIQIRRLRKQKKVKFVPINHRDKYSALYRQKYKLLINNTGHKPASIINWRIVNKNTPERLQNGYVVYDGLNPSFYDQENTSVSPPLTIELENPLELTLEIGVRIPSKAWKVVREDLKFNKEYDYYKASRVFNRHGYSAFGQGSLSRINKGERATSRHFSRNNSYQKFKLILTLGNGETVSAKFSHDRAFHRQGETN